MYRAAAASSAERTAPSTDSGLTQLDPVAATRTALANLPADLDWIIAVSNLNEEDVDAVAAEVSDLSAILSTRGVAQSCPLSPALFAVGIAEPLAELAAAVRRRDPHARVISYFDDITSSSIRGTRRRRSTTRGGSSSRSGWS